MYRRHQMCLTLWLKSWRAEGSSSSQERKETRNAKAKLSSSGLSRESYKGSCTSWTGDRRLKDFLAAFAQFLFGCSKLLAGDHSKLKHFPRCLGIMQLERKIQGKQKCWKRILLSRPENSMVSASVIKMRQTKDKDALLKGQNKMYITIYTKKMKGESFAEKNE